MEGIGCVLQKLRVQMKTVRGKYKYRLCSSTSYPDETKPVDDNNSKSEKNSEDIFMQLCVLTKGECFGIGIVKSFVL